MHLRSSLATLLAVLCVTLAACGPSREAPSGAAPTSGVAFTNVNLLPMDRSRIIENQTVLVLGSRIEKIGPADATDVPAGARRVDGKGGYLMPGLADMHAHVDQDSDLLLFLANGVTTVRNMAGGPEHLQRRQRIARGELLGPTIYTAGPVIDGPVELWPGNAAPPLPADSYEVIETRLDGERLAREQSEAGYDFLKVYDNLPAEAYQGVAAAAQELGIPVAGHVPFGVGLSGVLESGIASIEHLRGYVYELLNESQRFSLGWDKRSRFLGWNHIDATRFSDLVQATVEAGVWNVPTLTRYQKNMMPDEEHMQRYRSPEARYVSPEVIHRMISGRSTENGRYGAFREADFEVGLQVFQVKKAFTKALHDAGAKLLLGSDDWFGGFATHQELANLVAAGLTPYEAVATGTKNAAIFLGQQDEFGRLEAGMRADLVLVRNNPLEDVRHAKDIAGVMVRGRWLAESQLAELLEQVAASHGMSSASPNR